MTEQENDGRKESDDMDKILRTQNLCKYYGSGENEVRAVQDANIDIQKGEFVAIVGKSGSGKSTLLHMLGGLDPRQAGKYLFAGKTFFLIKRMPWQYFGEEKSALFSSRLIWYLPLMCGKILYSRLAWTDAKRMKLLSWIL